MTAVGFANLCAFLTSLAMGVLWVGIPYLLIDWFHAEAWHLGLIGGLVAGVRVATGMLPGRIAGRVPRHYVMAAGALFMGVGMAAMTIAFALWFVLVLMVFVGTGLGLFWVALEAWLGDGAGPTELRSRMGWFNVAWSAGDTLGSFLGGGLFGLAVMGARRLDFAGLQAAPCLLGGGLFVVIMVLVLTRLHKAAPELSRTHLRDAEVPRSPARGGQASLAVFWVMALIANCAGMAMRGTLVSIFPDFGKGVLLSSQFTWGILLGTTCLARTLGFIYWQRQHDWEYRPGYFFGVQALLPLAAIILVFNSSYWLFLVAFFLAGFGTSKIYLASIFYSTDTTHFHDHRVGIHEAFANGGSILLIAVGVIAYATTNPRSPYIFMFALLALGMLIQGVLYLRSRWASS